MTAARADQPYIQQNDADELSGNSWPVLRFLQTRLAYTHSSCPGRWKMIQPYTASMKDNPEATKRPGDQKILQILRLVMATLGPGRHGNNCHPSCSLQSPAPVFVVMI